MLDHAANFVSPMSHIKNARATIKRRGHSSPPESASEDTDVIYAPYKSLNLRKPTNQIFKSNSQWNKLANNVKTRTPQSLMNKIDFPVNNRRESAPTTKVSKENTRNLSERL